MTRHSRSFPFALLLALLPASASAQTIYVDCGSTAPSPQYGAAYGIPGTWNSLALIGGGPYAMVDSQGEPTTVTASSPGWCDQSSCDAPELDGDHAALLEDWFNGDCYASPNVVYVSGLAHGQYQVFVYGYNACSPSVGVTTRITLAGDGPIILESGGAPFPGGWAHFPIGTGAFDYSGGLLTLTTQSGGYGGIAGFQLVHLGPSPTPYCFGNAGACPCGVGDEAHGCPSSVNPAGALLRGSGSAELGNDSFKLTSYGTTSTVVTFIQANDLLEDGFGVPFGDGLRCAGGNLVRLVSRQATNGVATYPAPGDDPISVRGMVPPGGGFRGYQVWYRDPNPGFCTSDTFNLTNAVGVEWY